MSNCLSMKPKSVLILMLWLGLCSGTSLSVSEIKHLLMDFYTATGGPHWSNNTGWDSSISHCNGGWYGVSCTDDGQVSRIDARRNSLSGSLPTSLSSLTHMTDFRVSFNSLSGSLPASWSSLTQMANFFATSNSLSGSLPASWSSLTQMANFSSDSNPMSGSLPTSWSSLTQMSRWGFFSNSLSGSLPASWSSFTRMRILYASSNSLSGSLPASWSSITQMAQFYAHSNSLSGSLPASWASMTPMLQFHAYSNSLSGSLPTSWSSFTQMSKFHADSNSLSGSLPASWSSFTKLSYFNADSSYLSGSLPASWSSLNQMSYFNAYSNFLSGSLPASWSALTQMKNLLFRNNRLSGTVWSLFANMSTLGFVDLGSNKLSGSFSTAFGAQSQLVFFAIDGNLELDWSMSVFYLCKQIRYLLMQNCSIRGTLPSVLEATNIDTLLLRNNRMSGTVPPGLLQSVPTLRTLVLGQNQISGTVANLDGGNLNLQSLLMNGMRISGTIPLMPEAKSSCPTCPKTYLPCAMDGDFCVTSPNYPAKYSQLQTCTIEINADGTLTALNFDTEPGYDLLNIAGVDYSGTVGPIGVPVQANTTVSWLSDRGVVDAGWRLCWSSNSPESALTQSTKPLQVLSLARNYITGETNNLEPELSLQTLLVSSNYLRCRAVGLDDATNLGKGDFEDPSSSTLKEVGKVLQGVTGSNPFEYTPTLTLPNTVLAFAGNILMTRDAAFLPPVEAHRLLQEDEIELGRRHIFPGYSNAILFMCCVLPGLVLFYVVGIVGSTRGVSGMVEFARSGGSGCANHLLVRSTRPLMALMPIGLVSLIVDVVWSSGRCVDFFILTTIATAQSDGTWQWFWVLLNCCASVIITLLLVRLQRYGANPKSEFNQPQWSSLFCSPDAAVSKRAIDAWRVNMGVSDLSPQRSCPYRSLISLALHVPVLCIAMAPSVGYVFALNVPAGSGWYVAMFGNSLVVTMMKKLLSLKVFPGLSHRLARLKYGISMEADVSSYKLAVMIYRTQSNSLLAFDIGSVLLAPLIAVYLFDDSCLRYYLNFADDLQRVLNTWQIGDQGSIAYRPQFCSRTLVSAFAWVWLQLLTIRAFWSPALELIKKHPNFERIQALQASFAAWIVQLRRKIMCKGETAEKHPQAIRCKKALKQGKDQQKSIVEIYIILLILISFGPLCPLLFFVAPIFVWTNLCSISWLRTQGKRETYLERLADKVAVQHPTKLFTIFAVFTQWSVATVVFIDLEFTMGPIILFVVFWGIHLAMVAAYYLLQGKSNGSAEQAETGGCMPTLHANPVGSAVTTDSFSQDAESSISFKADKQLARSKKNLASHAAIEIGLNRPASPRKAQQKHDDENPVTKTGFRNDRVRDLFISKPRKKQEKIETRAPRNGDQSQRFKPRSESLEHRKGAVMQDHKTAVTKARMSVGQLRSHAEKRDDEWQSLQRKQALEREHFHRGTKREATTNNNQTISEEPTDTPGMQILRI